MRKLQALVYFVKTDTAPDLPSVALCWSACSRLLCKEYNGGGELYCYSLQYCRTSIQNVSKTEVLETEVDADHFVLRYLIHGSTRT